MHPVQALPRPVAAPSRRLRPPAERSKRRHETLLFKRYRRFGDLAAREELTERFLPLAKSVARRYERGSEPLDDLIQVASLALVKAIDRFDPDRGDSFSSYAVPTILGELKRHFRDQGWALHVPRGMQERVLKINGAMTRLGAQNGSSPTPGEIAADLGLPVEEVLESTTVGKAFKSLPKRERKILYGRFVEELTQRQVAEQLGVSQMHVSRLQRRALDRLRMIAEGVPPA